MSYKKWIKLFFIISFFIITFIISINYWIDPLWTFPHSHKFNKIQKSFDERQLKTNYIYNRGLKSFDGILLGSSRSTFINQNDFKNMNIYNYSFANMYPYEYDGYIDFAKKVKGQDFKYIIIGADFYGTNVPKDMKSKMPEFYINKTEEIFYKYKMLLSLDVFEKSLLNIKYSLIGRMRYYDRKNIKYQERVIEDKRIKSYNIAIKGHTNSLSNDKYMYNDNYLKILEQIKRKNPNTKIIIFTSPISSNLLVSIIKEGKRINEYKRWINEMINVFGEVNHFMDINTITLNLQNYPDDDHAYPYVLKLLANKVSGEYNNKSPVNFGIVLNKGNVDSYFHEFEEKIKDYKTN